MPTAGKSSSLKTIIFVVHMQKNLLKVLLKCARNLFKKKQKKNEQSF